MNRIARFTALATLTLAPLSLAAQTAVPVLPPTFGMVLSYQYWPTQYVQFVTGSELPYSMFEFDVDATGKQPLYHVVLTDKDGARTHYSNADGMIAAYKATGEASWKAEFAVDLDETEKVGAASTVRFTAHDGKPVEFRFVQGSDISEQGSGLTDLSKAPIPIFAYREQGAVAGEGTVLKIGEAVSTAEVWTEISRPPYFVGYRGAITRSAHLLVMPKATESWKVTKSATALTVGSTWELDNERGDHRTLRIEKVEGAKFTIAGNDKFHPGIRTTLEATRTSDGWSVERVRLQPVKDGEKHFTVLTFTPAAGTAPTSTMELAIGKKQKVATATVAVTGDAAKRTEAIKGGTPAWAAGKEITEETAITADSVTITAK